MQCSRTMCRWSLGCGSPMPGMQPSGPARAHHHRPRLFGALGVASCRTEAWGSPRSGRGGSAPLALLSSPTDRARRRCLQVEVAQENDPSLAITSAWMCWRMTNGVAPQAPPEMLASFVTPQPPAVEAVLADAAALLGEMDGRYLSLGYQSGDRSRVLLTVGGAIYAALQGVGSDTANRPRASRMRARRSGYQTASWSTGWAPASIWQS